MKPRNITHSKVKNTGVLFELLVRQITVDTLENKPNSKAVSLMRKYFQPKTELGKELQLYRTFFEMGPLTEIKASKVVDLIVEQHQKISQKKLLQEKYELVKELKENYNQSFFNTKIPFYRIYASIYKTLLAESTSLDVTNIQEVAESRFTLIEHLVQNKKSADKNASEVRIIEEFRNQTEDLRLLAYKIALDKFNQKYQNLNNKQRTLLKEYINSVSDSDRLVNYVHSEIDPLKEEITSLARKEKDQVLKIKLDEVCSQLNNLKDKKKIRDGDLAAMMIAYQIASELNVL